MGPLVVYQVQYRLFRGEVLVEVPMPSRCQSADVATSLIDEGGRALDNI
jgi:hypothetical protein